jgi:hypothetical protein
MKSSDDHPCDIHQLIHDGNKLCANVYSTAADKEYFIQGFEFGLFPVVRTIQSYGVAQVAYMDSGYIIADKEVFIELLVMLRNEMKRVYGDDAAVLFHVRSEDIDLLHNALVFAGFCVDGSLSNGARSLAAYTFNL